MDPDVTLKSLRELVDTLQKQLDAGEAIHRSDVEAVCTHFQALDHWFKRGGFLPYEWDWSKHV
jgi:hypothetical protein